MKLTYVITYPWYKAINEKKLSLPKVQLLSLYSLNEYKLEYTTGILIILTILITFILITNFKQMMTHGKTD